MKNRRKYKFQGGIQRIENDTPDYSNAYKLRAEQNAKNQMGGNLAKTGLDIAGTAIGVPGLGGIAQGVGQVSDAVFKDAKGNYKNKTSEILANQFNPLDKAGKSLNAVTGMLGGNFKNNTAAADLFSGSLIGTGLGALGMKNPFGKTTQEKVKDEAIAEEKRTAMANINKRYSEGTATDAQAALAKKGKYKLKTGASAFKQPRMIETEGREPIFSPKKADGTRDLLYYNPNDPTHEEGGVKAIVMPKRPSTQNSLVGSGIMAVGAKQLKVNNLNNTAFTENLGGMPAANAANKFMQPMAGINQVARNIPEYRRKATIKKPMSHRKENPDTNRVITPPTRFDDRPKQPISGQNNNFKKGGEYVKVYAKGTSGTKLNLGDNKKKINTVEYLTPKTFTGRLSSDVEEKKPILNKVPQELTNSNFDPRERTYVEPLEPRNNSIKEFEAAANRPRFNEEPLTPKQASLDLKLQPEKERKVSPVKIIKKTPLPAPKKEAVKPKKETVNKEQVINNLANKFFNQDFIRAEQERKADSTQYANNVVPTALRLAGERGGQGRLNYVTENRKYHALKGKKTGNMTCISGACLINKESGTNLPLNTKLLSNPDIAGDNTIATRHNPTFAKQYNKLGFSKLNENAAMQAGDFVQLGLDGNPFHMQVFLGNKKEGPLIAQDHGNEDQTGIEVQEEKFSPKLNTVADAVAQKQAGNVYRYMGLPKKSAMSKEQALAKAKVSAGMKKGNKYVNTYDDGTESTATYKHTKTFKSKPAYQAALQAHDDSLNLYGQSRYFTDLVKGSGLYNSTVENPEVRNITRTGTGKTHSPLKAYGAPNDSSEDIMTIAGMNPMRKDLYSRKENKYKSFKEYEEAKATGNPEKHEGYEINMYKHPEMALRYEPDTTQVLQPKKPKLNLPKDTAIVRRPRIVTNITDTTSKKDKEVVALNKSRGKFVGREKTFLEKAGEFLDKVGPSNRMSNGKKVKVYK
jgi:hypothetical protein